MRKEMYTAGRYWKLKGAALVHTL